MEITEIRIRRSENTGKLIGTASVTFDKILVIRDFRIVDGSEGRFVAFPSRKTEHGEAEQVDGEPAEGAAPKKKYFDVAFCLDRDFRTQLCDKVLQAFETHDE